MGKAYNPALPKVYCIDDITPVVDPSAFVHPSAVLIGDVIVGAALAFVKAEDRIPPRALAAGIPARVLRTLSEEELKWKRDNMALYQQLAERSASTMRQVEALTAVERQRRRIDIPGAVPLSELKKRSHEL